MSYTTIKDRIITLLKLISDFTDSYTASTLSFDAETAKVSDSANGLAFVQAGDSVTISGSTSNNGTFKVSSGSLAGEFTVDGILTDEAAGSAVTLTLPTHVVHGDYSLFDKGVGNFLVLVPGSVSEAVKEGRSEIRTWTYYLDMFIKFTDEATAWTNLVTLRSAIIDKIRIYPHLNSLSGILQTNISAPDDPEAIYDAQNNGPFWLSQRMVMTVTERTAQSGGDYA